MHPLPASAALALILVAPALAQDATAGVESRIEEEREFMRMGQPEEPVAACAFQRPPEDIADTPYLRNGYEAMRRILAMEKWQETGSCDCFYAEITYDEAIEASQRFVVSSNPEIPFRVYDMQQVATELVDRRAKACGD